MAQNKKKKILQHGLDEIYGGDLSLAIDKINKDMVENNTTYVDIAKIKSNPYQPRKYFDKEKINELSESIKNHGLIQPIILSEYDKDKYYVIAGERRLIATKQNKEKSINSIVLKLNDDQLQDYAILENIQREDLNPLEEAISFKQLMTSKNLTQEKLAERVSKSRPYVTNSLRLLKLPETVIDMVFKNQLTVGQVRPLIQLNKTDSILLAKKAVKDNLTSRQMEKLAKVYLPVDIAKKTSPKKLEKDIFSNQMELDLSKKLGAKVSILKNKIVIDCSNFENMDMVVNHILKCKS